MKEGEGKEKREMGEIMPMKPPIPVVEGEAQPTLLPFPFMNLATTESVMEAIKLLLEEKPAGVRKSDVYYLLRSDEAPINDKSRGPTKTTNYLYTLISRTMDKLTKEEHLIKTESGFGGIFTIDQPSEQPIIAPLSKTLYNVDKRYRLIRKLSRDDKTVENIMEIVGVSRSTVNKVLNKTRPKPKPKPEAKPKTTVPTAPTVSDQPLPSPMPPIAPHPKRRASLRGTAEDYKERVARIKELHEAGKTTEEIKAEIGCSSTTVNRIVEKFHKASPPLSRGRGNYGPRKYPPKPPAPPAAPPADKCTSSGTPQPEPVQKRPVGRPRIHPKEIVVTLHRPKGFWGWIIRFAEQMMIRRSRRRAQKAAKMLGMTPESIQALIKRGPTQ